LSKYVAMKKLDDIERVRSIAYSVALAQRSDKGGRGLSLNKILSSITNAHIDVEKKKEIDVKEQDRYGLDKLIDEFQLPNQINTLRNNNVDNYAFQREDLINGDWLSYLPDGLLCDDKETPSWQAIQCISSSVTSESMQFKEHQNLMLIKLIGGLLTKCSGKWSFERRWGIAVGLLNKLRDLPKEFMPHFLSIAHLIYFETNRYPSHVNLLGDHSSYQNILRVLIVNDTISSCIDELVYHPSDWLIPSYDIFLLEGILQIFGIPSEIETNDCKATINSGCGQFQSRLNSMKDYIKILNTRLIDKSVNLYIQLIKDIPRCPYWLVGIHYLISTVLPADSKSFRILIMDWMYRVDVSSSAECQWLWLMALVIRISKREGSLLELDKFSSNLITHLVRINDSNVKDLVYITIKLASLNRIIKPEDIEDIVDPTELTLPVTDLANLLGYVDLTSLRILHLTRWLGALWKGSLHNVDTEEKCRYNLKEMLRLYGSIHYFHVMRELSLTLIPHTTTATKGSQNLKDCLNMVTDLISPQTEGSLDNLSLVSNLLKIIIENHPHIWKEEMKYHWEERVVKLWKLLTDGVKEIKNQEITSKLLVGISKGLLIPTRCLWLHLLTYVADVCKRINKYHSEAMMHKVLEDHADFAVDLYYNEWTVARQNGLNDIVLHSIVDGINGADNVILMNLWCSEILPLIWPFLNVDLKIIWWPLALNSNDDAATHLYQELISESFIFGNRSQVLADSALIDPQASINAIAKGAVAPDTTQEEDESQSHRIINVFFTPKDNISGYWNLDRTSSHYDRINNKCTAAILTWGEGERGRLLRPVHLLAITLWASVWRQKQELEFILFEDRMNDDEYRKLLPNTTLLKSLKLKPLVKGVDVLCKIVGSPVQFATSTGLFQTQWTIPVEEVDELGSLILAHSLSKLVAFQGSPSEVAMRPKLISSRGSVRISAIPPLSFTIDLEKTPLPELTGRLVLSVSLTAISSTVYQLNHVIAPMASIIEKLSKNLWTGVIKTFIRLINEYFKACMSGPPPAVPAMPRHPQPIAPEFHWGAPLLNVLNCFRSEDVKLVNKALNSQSVTELVKMINLYCQTGIIISDALLDEFKLNI